MTRARWPDEIEYYRTACADLEKRLEVISSVRFDRNSSPKWVVTSRVKEEDSVARKLSKYPDSTIEDITDLAGVRVVVESISVARQLRDLLVSRKAFGLFKARRKKVDDFMDAPRPDGYRGIHLLGSTKVQLTSEARKVPVEIQIRTFLQHQWSELSHRDFYKDVSDIPSSLLERMRVLSNILHCADQEAEHLTRDRLLDKCNGALTEVLRLDILEELHPDRENMSPREVGELGFLLREYDRNMRRVLYWVDERDQRNGLAAIGEVIKSMETASPEIARKLEQIYESLKRSMDSIPDA